MSRSPSRTLKLTYLGDASSLSKSTKDANNDVKSLGDRAKDVGKKLAVAFVAIGAAGVAMGKKLFDAFEEVSTANARIEAIVSSMGNFEGQIADVTDRLVDQANATAALTGVDRTLIKESQALLLTFNSVNKTADQAGGIFDRATDAAVDLAAAGFGSVSSNATSLGKALEDPIKGLASLGRQGVTFTQEQQDVIRSLVETNKVAEAQEIILAAIERQVGGTAEATANGSDRMRQKLGILRDTLAMALAPAFERIVELGLDLIDKVGRWWEVNGDNVIETFRRWGTRISDTAKTFRDFASDVLDELRERGAIERLKEAGADVASAWSDTRDAFDRFSDTIGLTGSEAGTFARIIELQYIKPLEFFADRLEKALGLLERLFDFSARVKERIDGLDFKKLGQLAPGGSGFTPGGLGLTSSAPSGGGITVNVQGAIDPERTARQIRDLLAGNELRSGVPAVAGATFS